MSNAYASNYVQNIVCTVAGFYSAIDPKSAIWNKGLNLTQIAALRYTPTQLDALTKAKVNVLRYKGANTAPVLLHDRTAAIIDSDFSFVLRMNIHGLVIDTTLRPRRSVRRSIHPRRPADDLDEVGHGRGHGGADQARLHQQEQHHHLRHAGSAEHGHPVLRQDIPGAFFLWRSKRLARGRRLRPEPGSVVETNANRPAWRTAAASVSVPASFRW